MYGIITNQLSQAKSDYDQQLAVYKDKLAAYNKASEAYQNNQNQYGKDKAGLRIMCQFVEDIYQVVDLLRKRTDINILEERDYVHNKKPSGYRSYHIIFEYPVQMLDGEKVILAEIQVRTLAMNFWATVEHSLNYKYKGEFPDDLKARLERSAEAAFHLDEEMSEIRDELQETKKQDRVTTPETFIPTFRFIWSSLF